jgi:hypothetical protein
MGRVGLHHPRPAPCGLGLWGPLADPSVTFLVPPRECLDRQVIYPTHPPAGYARVQTPSGGVRTGHRSISSKEASVSGGASMVPSGPRASVGDGAVWSCPSWTWSVVELIWSLLWLVAPCVDRSGG